MTALLPSSNVSVANYVKFILDTAIYENEQFSKIHVTSTQKLGFHSFTVGNTVHQDLFKVG